jgi:hypothetical protein
MWAISRESLHWLHLAHLLLWALASFLSGLAVATVITTNRRSSAAKSIIMKNFSVPIPQPRTITAHSDENFFPDWPDVSVSPVWLRSKEARSSGSGD